MQPILSCGEWLRQNLERGFELLFGLLEEWDLVPRVTVCRKSQSFVTDGLLEEEECFMNRMELIEISRYRNIEDCGPYL